MKLLSSDAIRRCLVADPGNLIFSSDFDQIELRVAAALSGEPTMIAAAKEGRSLHKVAAERLFGLNYTQDQYRYTKNINFGWLFGGGPKTLSEQAGIPFETARDIIKQYETEFSALASYRKTGQERVLRSALSPREYDALRSLRSRLWAYRTDTQEGRKAAANVKAEIKRLCWHKVGYITTPFGRRLPVDADKAYTWLNYEVQSSARDIMGDAFLRIMDDKELNRTAMLIIHDEILGQAPRDIAEYMANRYGLTMTTTFLGVPITATGKVYGKSWGHGYTK